MPIVSYSTSQDYCVQGAGLGLRRGALLSEIESTPTAAIQFLEVAPENWIPLGGRFAKRLRALTERYPFVAHGLSLSIGSPAPLDEAFIYAIRDFMQLHQIRCYSEHLSFCSDDGHLYDLLPIPFTEEAVNYVAERVLRVQDILGQRIALENASYYTPLNTELTELEFIQAVLQQADCGLLLDINNIYVNAINHQYDATAFLSALPAERIQYAHIAGHYQEADDLIVDTHGSAIIEPVWQLLALAYQRFGVFPTLVERDFNIPPLAELLQEVHRIQSLQSQIASSRA